ncbi:unnamed protein product [Adineta steineri]|uniref:EF-hand domain-containing protein n=1 Tax=Adineta steineri TaxID=433720 RepID=A0A819C6C1_9BILA|nr:unnamed protein product [Adineta steineri]CAF3815466.1 unnamed protein product [Adineta steineri]
MQENNNNDDFYKQIFYSNNYLHYDKDVTIKLNVINQLHLFIFLFLILTTPSNALPIYKANSPPSSYPAAIVQVIDHSTSSMYPPQVNSYKVYRRLPIPSYSNGAVGQVYDQTNVNRQQELKRERYRRTMIDKMFSLFDEDVNGQISKDELYSLTLRLNIFPKVHHFLKQTSSSSSSRK